MTINQSRGLQTWLFNPFIYVAGLKSLILGLVLMTISALIGFLTNTHFDGVLDMHRGIPTQFYVILLEVLIDWMSISIVLFVLGAVLSKSKIRWVDVFGTQAVARWPLIPAAVLMVFIPDVTKMDLSNLQGMNSLIVPAMIILVFVIWLIALMFNAYRVSCNLYGTRLIASFIGGIVSAEILSKILIVHLIFGMLISPSDIQSTALSAQKKDDNIEIAKDILVALNANNYEQASIAFDDNMKNAFPVSKMSLFWTNMKAQAGKFEKSMEPTNAKESGFDTIFILCHFEKAKFNMKTVFNDKHQVIGLFFLPYQEATKTIELNESDLKKYLGVYSSPSFPLKISITNKGSQLIGQATGQASFELSCYDIDKFKYDPSGLKLEFIPEENTMVLLQAGGRYELKRE